MSWGKRFGILLHFEPSPPFGRSSETANPKKCQHSFLSLGHIGCRPGWIFSSGLQSPLKIISVKSITCKKTFCPRSNSICRITARQTRQPNAVSEKCRTGQLDQSDIVAKAFCHCSIIDVDLRDANSLHLVRYPAIVDTYAIYEYTAFSINFVSSLKTRPKGNMDSSEARQVGWKKTL